MIENEYRVVGPPGCGKSTYLIDQASRRTEAGQNVLIASMTKAAAAEVGRRRLAIPEEQIGTLHSHALHALGRPKLCVEGKAIKQWNDYAPMGYWLSGAASKEGDPQLALGDYRGDKLHFEYTLNRCRLIPREEWCEDVRDFATAFESWKYKNDYFDFQDLIHKAYEDDVDPPGEPNTILVDECQDQSKAEMRLLRRWAGKVDKLIIVGDPDQAIFSFRGADPTAFYDGAIPEGHTKVLEQSYRVPRAVHAEAMRMIERIENRVPVVYHPRDEDGRVSRAYYSMRTSPYDTVNEIEELLKEPDEAATLPKVMCLFSCAYMAQPLMAALRKAGIPFWNPYAIDRNNFNPLHAAKGTTTLDRVLHFLKPNQKCFGDKAKTWTWSEFNSWAEICGAESWLKHGMKAEIKRRASVFPKQEMTIEEIYSLLSSPEVLDELADCELTFLMKHVNAQKNNSVAYCVDIVNRLGYTGITEPPRVVIGTYHSVKGGEAENVFVCPDLSVSGFDCYGNDTERDALYRLFYVGFTRARRHLRLTQQSSDKAMEW